MNESEDQAAENPLDALAEQFVLRYRNGERSILTEYTDRYPALANEILELFPTLMLMEDARPQAAQATGGFSGVTGTSSGKKLERLGDYRILREVGRGGMGIVYEAEQESLGRHVALKILPMRSLLDARHLQRFQRESRAAARLHHTNIVPVFGVGEQDGLHYYVMQFIHGLGLDQVLVELKRLRKSGPTDRETSTVPAEFAATSDYPDRRRQGDLSANSIAESFLSSRLRYVPRGTSEPEDSSFVGSDPSSRVRPTSETSSIMYLPGQTVHTSLSDTGREFWHGVARVGVQVADALAYAHSQGVLHRDIKPSNLLLDLEGNVWVTDFGLAHDSDEAQLTCSGDILGTLRYIAPERLQGLCDRRSDVYALGMTIYELLTLRPAFQETDRNQLLQQLAQHEPPSPRSIDANVPRDLETIVLKAIEKEPARRYASIGELAEDLRRYLTDQPVHARRSPVWERAWRLCRRNRVVAGLSGGVVALMAIAIMILALGNTRIRREAAAKDAAIITSHKAVDQMLRRVASNKLSDVPLAHTLRESLLSDAVDFYEGFVSKGVASVSIRESLAATLHELGVIRREIARYEDARKSFERSIELRKELVIADPRSAAMREKLADTQEALAMAVWKIETGPPGSNDREAEIYFRQAAQTYSDLERDWPDRRQPIGNCLRQLAQLAFERGEKTTTEQLLTEAIAEEEAFLKQHPERTESRIGLCWACAQLDEEVLRDAPERTAHAERVLKTGLHHVGLVLDENPRSTPAREVAAYLHFGLGRCYSRTDEIQAAIHSFQKATAQIGSLCTEFPWNDGYWTNARYFHRASVKCLQQAGKAEEAKKLARHAVDWFRDVAPHVPRQPGPQAELDKCRKDLIALLGGTEQPAEAEALSKFEIATTPTTP